MRIGHYRIVREIAKGGMGATYLAKREDVDMRVCLKTILPAYAAEPSYREMFLSEARIAAKASHPNLASLIDYGEHESGALWLVSEFVDGTDLTTLLWSSKYSALSPAHAAGIAIDVASGLLHLHTPDHRRPHAIVHRDISARNVMVSYEGYAKLIDFGIAKTTTGEGTETDIKGKLQYMAPEMLRGEPIGVAVDQWALGVMLYRALCSRFPYKRTYNGRRPAPPSSPHGPLDPRWSSILERLLQPDPADRYPSLAALLEELGPLAPTPGERLALGRALRRKRPPPSALGAAPPAEPSAEPPLVTPRRDFGAMQPGERFGEWTILQKLGAGGMAVVYEASRQRSLGGTQHAALKLIRSEHAASEDFLSRFRSEVEISMRLSHQNIVHVLDAGEVDGVYFMAMEFVEGCDLDTLLDRLVARGVLPARRLPPYLAVLIGYEIARALVYAHTRNVVHRDISPHNVLVTVDGTIKLNDWGVSKAMTTADGKAAGTQHAVGKPYYMAPEQFRGDALDGRADLFGCGGTLFELLAGATPYALRGNPREDIHLLIHRVFTNDRPHTAEIAPDAPPALIHIIEELLQPNLELRMRSADALMKGLEPLVQLHAARHLAELVRTVQDESYSPPPTLLDALRAANTPRPASNPTLQLPDPLARRDVPTRQPVPTKPPSRLRPLLFAALFLSLLGIGVGTVAAVLSWPSDDRPSEPPTSLPPAESRGVELVPPVEPAAPTRAEGEGPPSGPSAPPPPAPVQPAVATEKGAADSPSSPDPSLLRPRPTEDERSGAVPERPAEASDVSDPDAASAEAAASPEPRACRMRVVITPAGTFTVGGAPRGAAPRAVRVTPGEHVVVARSPQGERRQRRIVCRDGEPHALTFDFL